MKWKTAKPGDRRVIVRFALLPIKLQHEYRWLEFVYINQRRDIDEVFNCFYFWKNCYFTTRDDYLEYLSCRRKDNLDE